MCTTRFETKYENLSAKFMVESIDYHKQFSHLYSHRLEEMTEMLKARVAKKWPSNHNIKKLCEIREEQLETCVIIGTIFKHQVHKPSILREISEENQLAPQPPRAHYADPEDKLILEDELQRVRLTGKVDTALMATGVVCAVLGQIEEDGRFIVEDFLFYESGPQRPLPVKGQSRKIVLVSGLDFVQRHNFTTGLNLLQNWIAGNISNKHNLVRIVVAGNSVRTNAEQRSNALQFGQRTTDPQITVQTITALDKFFAGVATSIPVDVMPGAFDPANFMLPQQPFHNCMFPQAAKNASFRSVPNPYACTVDNALIFGCAGQNISDLLRSTNLDDPLVALRQTLIWSHIAPTAPDTLACYPYISSDPLILKACPHVYFTGNCDDFASEIHTGSDGQRTRLVCVPNFSKTQSVAVVDLETLDCHKVSFCF